MLRIAFIDHHLNNYHADKFLSLIRGPLASHGAEIITAWESSPGEGDWCAQNEVPRSASISEAVSQADAVMLLAPDDIEDHLTLAREVLPFGKPIFIDKLLANSVTDAREIIELARVHNTPIYSSSSLRYAAELEAIMPQLQPEAVTDASLRGMNSLERYGIHTIAMALRLMGADVLRVADTGTSLARTVTLDYGAGRRAVLDIREAQNEWDYFGWKFTVRYGNVYTGAEITDHSAIYENLMIHVLGFFKEGHSDMPIEEALTAVAIIEAANHSAQEDGGWICLSSL